MLRKTNLVHCAGPRAGVKGKPVWITETGYISQPTRAGARTDHGSPEKQARWLAQAYQQARNAGVQKVFWLFLRDTNTNAQYFSSMGLMDSQNNQRPAWKALLNLGAK